MDLAVLAQIGAWGIAQWAIAIIVLAGVVGIVIVVTQQMGVQIPPFIIKVLWILLAVVIGVVAVKFLITML